MVTYAPVPSSVCITGIGVVSPLGATRDEFRDRLLAGESGVGPVVGFDPPDARSRLAAQGAEVILAACATVNAIIRREKIYEVDGALIMDCNAVLLKTAEGMAELAHTAGLRHSQRLLYQQPGRQALDEWMRLYNFRSAPQPKPERARKPEPVAAQR